MTSKNLKQESFTHILIYIKWFDSVLKYGMFLATKWPCNMKWKISPICLVVYSYCKGAGLGAGPWMEPGSMGSAILCKNIHTGLRQIKWPGLIVSYRAIPVPCIAYVRSRSRAVWISHNDECWKKSECKAGAKWCLHCLNFLLWSSSSRETKRWRNLIIGL